MRMARWRWICIRESGSSPSAGKNVQKVVCVDANLAATRDLYANAEIAGVTIVSHNEHAEEFLKKTEEKPDFVLLDPPRAGLGAESAEKLAELGAKEIVYLSCDPSTLARDLAVLTGSSRKRKKSPGQASAMKSRKCICSISSRRHFTSKPW